MNSEIDEDIAWSPMMIRNMEKVQIIRDNDLTEKAKKSTNEYNKKKYKKEKGEKI